MLGAKSLSFLLSFVLIKDLEGSTDELKNIEEEHNYCKSTSKVRDEKEKPVIINGILLLAPLFSTNTISENMGQFEAEQQTDNLIENWKLFEELEQDQNVPFSDEEPGVVNPHCENSGSNGSNIKKNPLQIPKKTGAKFAIKSLQPNLILTFT